MAAPAQSSVNVAGKRSADVAARRVSRQSRSPQCKAASSRASILGRPFTSRRGFEEVAVAPELEGKSLQDPNTLIFEN